MVVLGHERSVEKLREQRKIRAVAGNGIDKKLGLLHHVTQICVRTHLPLDESEADNLLGNCRFVGRLFIIDIVPTHQYRIFVALFIAR